MQNIDIYGGVTTQKVSFAYGTIAQAAADTMPGSINFGYDADTKTGAIFMEQHLMTSKVLSMTLGDATIEGMHTVVVKFLNDANEVSEMTFKTVDESLIQTLIDGESGGGAVYMAGEYIDINASMNVISVDYEPLYNKIKTDLVAGGIGDQTEINIHQSEEILGIQNSYLKDVEKIEGEYSDKFVFTKSTKENETTDAVDTSVVVEIVNPSKFNEEIETVKDSVSAIDGKIVDVSNAIGDVATDVDTIGTKVLDVSVAVDELYEKENAIEDAVAGLSGKLDSLEAEVFDLSTNRATKEEVGEIREEIAVINSSVNALESDVAALKSVTGGSWVDIHSLLNG